MLPNLLLSIALAAGFPSTQAGDAKLPSAITSVTSAPPAGHSAHGEAFNEGPRRRAYLMKGMPPVHLAVTTANQQAQLFFDQGIGQLHGFWYFEAERSFRQAAVIDPRCAMAYWGMAMANVNNAARARGFMQGALGLKDKASARERLWIEAYAEYWPASGQADNRSDKSRRQELIKRLENIVHEYPSELEAKAFLAFQLWDNTSAGIALSSHEAVDALIKQVLAIESMHPVHHYMIHLWDTEKPARALGSAALCGQSSPGIAHMWHMPGHIYAKLHRYADAAWQQEASARVDHAHMMRDHVLPDQIHNYAHNNQWLVEDLEYIGRVHDAVELAKNMIELPRHPRYNSLDVNAERSSRRSAHEGRRRLFEVLLRFELWDELIALSDNGYLEPTDNPIEQIWRLRTRGIAFFNKGEPERGRQGIAALEEMRRHLRDERFTAAEKAETIAKRANKSREQVATAMANAMLEFSGQLGSIENALEELQTYAYLADNKKDQANASFQKSKDIPLERRARLNHLLGHDQRAEGLFRQEVASSPNQVAPLAEYVSFLYQLGRLKEAGDNFQKLRALSADVDLDVPVMVRLRPLVAGLGLPADWRIKSQPSKDVGKRPDLANLGPFRWRPGPAPDWSLSGADGNQVSLKDYHGKPLVLIFYLGHGCPHCIKQLQAFEPIQHEFQSAGIALAAISTETPQGLKQTYELGRVTNGLRLLSDDKLAVFKDYDVFDDFEKTPLHGTFLIDADGLIRWQDISYEPFMDGKFLLREAKRLLTLPKTTALTRK
jgi:peroxiredoxin